jgi:uncharacterized protein
MIYPEKYDMLRHWFTRLNNAAIAFSGGVDSTFVLAVAQQILERRIIAYTVKTPYIPEWELEEAIEFCRTNQINHRVIKADIIPEIRQNPENRCYLCKRFVFSMLKKEAAKDGFTHLLDGSNADDTDVYRPGLVALKELGIISPLLENGITKGEVRYFSKKLGLSTSEKPSYACMLTRLPYNYEVRISELERIEKAERFLASQGYGVSRVRNHGDIARIELEKNRIAEFTKSPVSEKILSYFKELGYAYVTIDLEGYRTGSYDKSITQPKS